MNNSENLTLEMPSLPKGGGSMTHFSGQMGEAGPNGAATLSIPLAVTSGRGYAPTLSLSYNSQAGNGPFGMGWSASVMNISRHTRHGVPGYDDEDEFISPMGEILVPALHADGEPDAQHRSTLTGVKLPQTYRVCAYRPRVEQDFSRYEYWQPVGSGTPDFWVMYAPDGQIHLFGHADARIADPANATHTARWLLNASVTSNGEQIQYHYRAEDDAGCDEQEKVICPAPTAQRYLQAVYYGNKSASAALPGLDGRTLTPSDWLFILVLDYGERSSTLNALPGFETTNRWACRTDCFFGFEYGFALRTRRLCRQVLMFHNMKALSGEVSSNEVPVLVSRTLLEYEATAAISLLRSVRQMAWEADGRLQAQPPVEFHWQTFRAPTAAQWHKCNDLEKLNGQQPYQFVDLYGEGIAGVLYQDNGVWWYREPVRQRDEKDENAVIRGKARPLPELPSLQSDAMLADLNGDGHLQWVVTASGVNGHYQQKEGNPGEWLHFTPLAALPVEYQHPRAQLADLMGSGFNDLVLLGPRSVRLYRGQDEGWQPGEDVLQSHNIVLPVPGADPQTLVAFSDPAGSGQQHLMRVTAEGVTWWPNLGQGRFGQPIAMPGFSLPAASFNPDQLFLADIDGSGTVDLIYAQSDRLLVWLNQCGNRFSSPFTVTLPEGVQFDRSCKLQVADVQGLGVSSLLLSLPHPTPTHWVCHLTMVKPWLLDATNNNMGVHHTLRYRSSAQFWLDEKAEYLESNSQFPGSRLPFPLHLLWQTTVEDEITSSRLTGSVAYRHGVWDNKEREFLGFGRVDVLDSLSESTSGKAITTPPSLSRSWYATGIAEVDAQLPGGYWSGDRQAFAGFKTRLTQGEGEGEMLCSQEQLNTHAFCLHRALKGLPLRTEVYGLDGSSEAEIPYSVTEQRLQARLVEGRGKAPVVWPSVLETRQYHYERIAVDPQCSQQVILQSDRYGTPLHQVAVAYPRRQVAVAYPRRQASTVNLWPDSLPDNLPEDCRDEQQQILHLTLTQSRWHHLAQPKSDVRLLALPNASATEVFSLASTEIPTNGFNQESLGRLLANMQPTAFGGQQQIWYLDPNNQPTVTEPALPPRIAFSENAVLDEPLIAALPDIVTPKLLVSGGYHQSPILFPRKGSSAQQVWTSRTGYTRYADASGFYLPIAIRNTLLTGETTVTRDVHHIVIVSTRDAAGLVTLADYDWRFLKPCHLTDVNKNHHYAAFDALGQVVMTWFHGTENATEVGFSGPKEMSVPTDASSALALSSLPVAQCVVYVPGSWMSLLDASLEMPNDLSLTEDGFLTAMMRRRLPERLNALTLSLRQPPHIVTLTADRYDGDPQQQIRQQIMMSDGFGRALQTAIRHEAGDAWQRKEDGSLEVTVSGAPAAARSNFRWAVSGRTEYDNKGQPVKSYLPYFLNDWRYISNDSARQDLWADTNWYDPLGRIIRVTTSAGFERRTLLTPWFTVSEDENDTLI